MVSAGDSLLTRRGREMPLDPIDVSVRSIPRAAAMSRRNVVAVAAVDHLKPKPSDDPGRRTTHACSER